MAKKKINSRAKGARAERECRNKLRWVFRQMFGDAIPEDFWSRGQQFSGIGDSPDVCIHPRYRSTLAGDIVSKLLHIENKWVERLNLREAMAQAEKDAGGKIPVVTHKKSQKPWLLTMNLEDLPALYQMLRTLERILKEEEKPSDCVQPTEGA